MICSSLCRVPFIAVLLLRFERTHILRGPVFGGWVRGASASDFFLAASEVRGIDQEVWRTRPVVGLDVLPANGSSFDEGDVRRYRLGSTGVRS